MPRVSVLMSNYNTPVEFLKKAIDSVLLQTFNDFELIIVNDGSRDESREIIYDYAQKDFRVTIIENEENMGLPRSLNRGLDVCKGEYVVRMDTDDICYPDRLQKQVDFMDSNPKLILSGAWADIFSNDENLIEKTWSPVMCSNEEYRIRLMFSSAPLIIHPTVIFRRDMLNKYKLRYPENIKYKYAEDYKMWVQSSKMGEVGILEEVVIKYRNVNSDDRITIRHEKEMKKCIFEIQADMLRELNIVLTTDMFAYNHNLLLGRKPYDIKYKQLINVIIKNNKKYNVYSQEVLCNLLQERWYNIVYYGIAYEKNFIKRLKYFFNLSCILKVRFILSRITKNN